jgi:ribosome biogenesis protein Nip4
MINLLIALTIMCSSLGAVISKTTKEYGFRKHREHTEPLKLD